MEGYIDLKALNLQELVGVVNIYPWFSLARKELCERMCAMGDWGMSRYAEAAMYMSDRKVLARLLRKVGEVDYSDRNISGIMERCMNSAPETRTQDKPRVHVVGGDYFSQDEYEQVRRQDGDMSGIFAAPAASGAEPSGYGPEYDLCTETLARIYAEQGYYDQAKDIYSKLILAYPEKSVYFAALIEKLDAENQNQ